MRALVFGQSGLRKGDYLSAVQKVAPSDGPNFEIINLGERMQRIDPARRDPQLYPSLTVTEREMMRNQALEAIIREITENPKRDYVLNAHAVFKLDTNRGTLVRK